MPNNNKKQTKIAEETHASILRRKKEKLYFLTKRLKHASPHLHSSVEVLYVIEGTMELGMKQELFHMEEGDVGVINEWILMGLYGRSTKIQKCGMVVNGLGWNGMAIFPKIKWQLSHHVNSHVKAAISLIKFIKM